LRRGTHLSAMIMAPPHLHGDVSNVGNTFLVTEGSHSSTSNVPVVDGLPADRQSRRYSMQNHRRRARAPYQRGEPLREKVKLNSVVAVKTKGGCKYNCLRDVDEKYILDQRYIQKYGQQGT
jgi:hypothetical protein